MESVANGGEEADGKCNKSCAKCGVHPDEGAVLARAIIPTRLPGLNDYIAACRRNPKAGAKLKREAQDMVVNFLRTQLRGRAEGRVEIRYHWVEPNKRRDMDNISSFGRKVIQDALVKMGYLSNDGWRQIAGFSDTFSVGEPKIEIEILEVRENEQSG